MALLFVDSFDHYQEADLLSKWTATGYNVATIAGGEGRCGTNALAPAHELVLRGMPFGSSRGTVGCAFKIQTPTVDGAIFDFMALGNVTYAHLVVRVNVDGSLEVRRVGNFSVSSAASLGLSAPGLIHWDRWYFIELQALIDLTAGEAIVRLNNSVVISVTGVNTAGGGDTLLRQVRLQCPTLGLCLMDDFYALDDTGDAPNNTFLGDVRVEYLRPRAPAASQDWTLVGTKATHWEAVDDNQTPDGDTSYVESVTPGDTDTNYYEPTGLPSGQIFGAQLSLLARKAAIGPRVISPVVNDEAGPPHLYLSADNYVYHSSVHALNPSTDLPWTITEINAASFGVTVAT